MKQKVNTLLVMAVSLLLFACQSNDPLDIPMNEEIVIDLATNTTRAADNSTESYVEHIDVFIFEAENDKPGKKAHYERQQLNNAPMITLKALRSSFTVGTKYFVYLLANCNLSENTLGAMADYNALLNAKQEDPMLYITGLVINEADVPKYFLMDAVAKNNADQTAIELNNGKIADNTVLSATLRRAAAKVVVNITAGNEVEFKDLSGGNHTQGLGLYYVRNLSYDAFLLAEAKEDENIEAKVRTTSKGDTEYFNWDPETNPKTVSLVTYAYPNHWSNASTLEHETCIVMNLPMVYTSGGTTAEYPNSWYKIPMTDDQTLRRNNYYEVNIALNRPGATTESTPVDVEDIYYNVIDWTEQTIQVGNEDKPKYLMVNRNSMEMRNISQDATTLEFSSSSPVTITIKDVYYINKYGNKTSETPAINGTTISGSIAGNITVNSPIPTNNTIRYFTLVVTNQEGISREVIVEQYPLVYITNIQSYYSYRSDFLSAAGSPDGTATGNHFENRSDYGRFGISYDGTSYKYGNNGFFIPKFVYQTYDSGLSNVDSYTKDYTSDFHDPYNARMYHIRITATSDEYTLGRPKITNGVTDPGADNARMVSPSFMIASRLGTISSSNVKIPELDRSDYGYYNRGRWYWNSPADEERYNNDSKKLEQETYLKVYSEHAKQYVEVYSDATGKKYHLSDWRLPTEAELEIIYQYQGSRQDPANADAIDYLLNGAYYYSASGPVYNKDRDTNGTTVRCIRDVYEAE